MAVQPGLCRKWSETPKTRFLTTRLISFTGAVTISGPATFNGYIVYNATITDAESDPLTVAIPTCSPTPCIFNVNNGNND